MLLLTSRNTPVVYYGDELGMGNAVLGPEHQFDPWCLRVPGNGRDPVPTPMRWYASEQAGFTTGTPWLPVGGDAGVVNVAHCSRDERSILREDGERKVWVVLNLGPERAVMTTLVAASGTIALSTSLSREGVVVGWSLVLGPDDGCIVVFGGS